MGLRLVSTFAVSVILAVPAAAGPLIVRDSTGQPYLLNDDGTYGVIVRSDDGRSFALRPDGRWQDIATAASGEETAAQEQLVQMITTWVEAEGRDQSDAAKAKVRACIIAAVSDLPLAAKQEILKGSDFEDGVEAFIEDRPNMAGDLGSKLEKCFGG